MYQMFLLYGRMYRETVATYLNIAPAQSQVILPSQQRTINVCQLAV